MGESKDRKEKDPASAFLSLRLTEKVTNSFRLYLTTKGKADGIFFWSFQVNPVVTKNIPWINIPDSIFEYRVHDTKDFIVTEGTVVAVVPSIARKNIQYRLRHRLFSSDELVLVIEPKAGNLSYYASLNWKE